MIDLNEVDVLMLRDILSKVTGGDDGITHKHLQLPDRELVEQFLYVYGERAIHPYLKRANHVKKIKDYYKK